MMDRPIVSALVARGKLLRHCALPVGKRKRWNVSWVGDAGACVRLERSKSA